MRSRTRMLTTMAALAVTVVMALAPAAGAASGGGGKSHIARSTSSLSLVLLDSTDGLAHYGQRVTFNVATTATTEPFVQLACYQNDTLVAVGHAGFFSTYPWPWNQVLGLSSSVWTGGAADCTAWLYSASNTGKPTILATVSLHVFA